MDSDRPYELESIGIIMSILFGVPTVATEEAGYTGSDFTGDE